MTKERFVTQNCKPSAANPDYSFPKQFRLLRSGDFRRVYRDGMRVSGPLFLAFCCRRAEDGPPRAGITVPRSLGKAVIRNRIKRRMREAIRHEIRALAPGWDVVFNPRAAVLTAPFERLRREVRRVFERCNASSSES
ncbi:MAG TPA: ribonuclease P protein component [Bryobacterales bacterium]|nr:ribonuclease P protein component [Bryobacterales bacterium]